VPKSAAKDERAIYDFIQEIYKKRRVSERTYKRVQAALGDAATVELVGILGYYALISMTLNVFQAALDPAKPLPFASHKRINGCGGHAAAAWRRSPDRVFDLDSAGFSNCSVPLTRSPLAARAWVDEHEMIKPGSSTLAPAQCRPGLEAAHLHALVHRHLVDLHLRDSGTKPPADGRGRSGLIFSSQSRPLRGGARPRPIDLDAATL
jgi:hypothetical protein